MRKKILAEMEKKHITQKQLAAIIGVSNGVINKFLTQEKEIAFDIIWQVVRIVDPSSTISLMDAYSKEVTKKNIKLALEYYALNRRLDSLDIVLERAAKSNSVEIKEWGRVYEFFTQHQRSVTNISDPDQLIRHFRRINTPFKETNILLYIFEMYSYYFRNEYKTLYTTLINIPEDIMEIEHPFLRRCYMARVYELKCHVELKYKNNPIGARGYCQKLLDFDISDNFNATAYFLTGLSFIMEDFDKCIFNFKKCLKYYQNIKRQEVVDDIINQIEFAYVLWGKEYEFTSEFHKCLADVQHGSVDPSVLDLFTSSENTPYILLIKGIVLDDINLLSRSLIHFTKKGDLFRANYAGVELIKRGKCEKLLQDALSY